MIDPNSFDVHPPFLVPNGERIGLDFELLAPGGRQLDIDIFVEHHRQIVEIAALHFFSAIELHQFFFLRIEIQAMTQEVSKVLIFSKDEETDAQHAIGCGSQIFKINLGKVSDFELDAPRHKQLLWLALKFHQFEALLDCLPN